MKYRITVLLACGLMATWAAPAPAQRIQQSHRASQASAHRGLTAAQQRLHDAMRRLWEDHVTWTRLFIVSAAHDLPNAQATTERLLKNQVDIGNGIKPYYGEAAGSRLTALLTEHILIAAEIVTAARAGDTAQVTDATARWYANADQIADFLARANPKTWPQAEMRAMMHDHLDLTLGEAVAELQGDYAGSVRAYDDIHEQILGMADMLSEGIMRQFPNRVR